MKKYRLKQDWKEPGMTLLAGTIFRQITTESCKGFYESVGVKSGATIRPSVITSNPDWFEEVKEEPKQDVYEDAAKEIQMMSLFSDQVIANTLREKYIVIPRTANTVSEADKLSLIIKILNP